MNIGYPTPRTVKIGYLDKVTYDLVQQVLYEAYALHRADPQYLFLSPKSYNEYRKSIDPVQYNRGLYADFSMLAVISPATGKRVDIIALPNFDDSTIILGFLEN